ncbi:MULTISPECIES: hypothetical protein [Rodentibacter]|uniref:Uncharacterized protein n=1 Tax=Rodentibacter pneumotropicus TaxID=758 RepID=A0A4S2P634_9PAST|nr:MULTISPECIES: hypothetical protein [Pasteurellaceae]TGY50807.1 hypothetical protein E5343_00175 [Pasteurella caecimuris]TGZ98136.1 hypothetical protein D3M79_10390 [Rodentibacter pneumotropicus]THA00966.1 hypothetical protein D3M74_06465 [Rodentibacter pneumotropicus]THA08174.1 hypothetical protein D3M78_08145 [Rodentibacter pneumotropicus]THA09135.1 hypothetical protein D3M77_02850 [Rodentibacter pneumotropicus]
MCEIAFKEKSLKWLEKSMSDHDLMVADCLFKVIEKHGLEGAKAEIDFERAKRNLLKAYERKSALYTDDNTHKCVGDFACYFQQKEYKWAEQVKKTFSEQDIRMLDYALTYVKKAGIAQFEEELLSIKQVFQTNNVHHSPKKRTEWLESLFRLREEARLAEGRLLQHQANLLMIQDNLATLLKSLAFLDPTHELPEGVEGEINQTRKRLEDLTKQILS